MFINESLILKTKLFLILGFSCLFSSSVFAGFSEGMVSQLRVNSSSSKLPESKRNTVLFKLHSGIANACTWLAVENGSDYVVAQLLSAKSRNTSLKIWYDETPDESGRCFVFTAEESLE
ncbi:MAG: hypothetical protein ACFHVJ_15825 [Aestuariibacter sp.]